jgi:hypothetical protein
VYWWSSAAQVTGQLSLPCAMRMCVDQSKLIPLMTGLGGYGLLEVAACAFEYTWTALTPNRIKIHAIPKIGWIPRHAYLTIIILTPSSIYR